MNTKDLLRAAKLPTPVILVLCRRLITHFSSRRAIITITRENYNTCSVCIFCVPESVFTPQSWLRERLRHGGTQVRPPWYQAQYIEPRLFILSMLLTEEPEKLITIENKTKHAPTF